MECACTEGGKTFVVAGMRTSRPRNIERADQVTCALSGIMEFITISMWLR